MGNHMKHILCAITLMILTITLQASGAWAACSSPAGKAGDVIYNETEHVFQYCNDTDWIGMNKPGSGSGGCANPTVLEGQMSYNVDHRVLQGCAGNVHVAMGPVGGNGDQNGWIQITTGFNHTCGIRADGTGWCWGQGAGGALGHGGTEDKNTPTIITGGDTWKKLAAGNYHTCGIKSDDTLWCWGQDSAGALGNGAGIDSNIPVAVTGGGTWKDVSAGRDFACGIKSDDTLWCWGSDSFGKLGNGAVVGNQPDPYAISGGGSWKQVSINYSHACAIKSDDTAWCWGLDSAGELGNGAGTSSTSPTAVTGGHTWKLIAAGYNHTCAIKSDDSMWCWGNDYYGSVGTGGGDADPNQQNPVTVSGGGTWKSVSGGWYSSCGVKTDGSLLCWGGDIWYGLQANGSGGNQYVPTAISGGGTWTSVSMKNYHACAVRTNGSLSCWGTDEYNQLGNGDQNDLYKTSPTASTSASTWKALSSGGSDQFATQSGQACAIRSDDTIWCWGSNDQGQLGIGTTGGFRATPTSLSGGGTWKQVSTSNSIHTCAIKSDDTAWCWGNDSSGQLGNGATTGTQSAPSAVSGGGTWKKITAGYIMSCGIKSDDTLWCWGSDVTGQLGNGAPSSDQISPVSIDGGSTWKDISSSNQVTCGIKSDNTLWCWGSDFAGQLGNGAAITANQTSPSAVTGGSAWKSVSVGSSYTCGIKSDDTAWCWGSDSFGQLGNGATAGNQPDPVAVVGGHLWKSISAGRGTNVHATCGIRNDDTLWCWGADSLGTLGNGPTITANQDSPMQVQGGGMWAAVSVSGSTACSIATSGHLYCWGFAGLGQLANGQSSIAETPSNTLCGSPPGKPGAIAYNSASNILQYCDGNGWVGIVGTDP